MRRIWLAVLVALLFVAVGSTARATFDRTKQEASRTPRPMLKQWTAYVQKGAKLNPKPRFAKAQRSTIARIVRRNASQFHYVPLHVGVLRGRDGAPVVIVRVLDRPLHFSRSFRALWRRLDPLTREPGPDWHAYKYEAYYFEADGRHGALLFGVWNAWRKPPRGGGQWARNTALLPFPHG